MAGEGKEQSTAAAEDALWRRAFKQLVVWTVKTHRVNPADGEEMVQEAIGQFVAAGGRANPAEAKALLHALGSRINGIATNRRRKKALRAVGLTKDGAEAELDDPPDPEQRAVSDDIARRAVSALLERVEGDELLFMLVMQITEGVEDPAEQAKVLGRDILEVYNARRRLKTHAAAVAKLMEAW